MSKQNKQEMEFHQLPETALEEWRNLEQTVLLVRWLEKRTNTTRMNATFMAEASDRRAAGQAGASLAFEEAARMIAQKREPMRPITQDDTFVDPASRKGRGER